jgi:hypothetical protein
MSIPAVSKEGAGSVTCEKKLINIWLAFRILGPEINFDNFIV